MSDTTWSGWSIIQEVFSPIARAFRVLMRGLDGSGNPQTVLVDSAGSVSVSIAGSSVDEASFEKGLLAFGAISGTYATLLNVSGDGGIVTITSDLNQPSLLSFDGGTTDHLRIPAGAFVGVWDFKEANKKYTGTMSVKRSGSTSPTRGEISVVVVK